MAERELDKDEQRAQPAEGDRGNTLEDASDEAVEEIRRRRDGGGHAGAGDIG